MFFQRNILIGFAAGLLVGVLGYKLYNDNKDTIDGKIKSLADKLPGANKEQVPADAPAASAETSEVEVLEPAADETAASEQK